MRYLKGLFVILFSLLLISYAEALVYSDTQLKNPHSYAAAVKIAAPSVVNVYTDRGSRKKPGIRLEVPPGYYRSHPTHTPAPTQVRRITLGSGVLIDKEGDLLTNYHVVRNATRILIALNDGRHVIAKVVGHDQETDLAVLHINLKNLHPAILGNSNKIEVGDVVLAIGNPFGLGQTVTQGIVSAVGRSTIGINQLENYIQTDAAINPGSSGGALINTKGEVIGINTGIYSRSGGYQGVGFSIPINVALNVMQQIIKTGVVVRGWLGARIRAVTSSIAKTMNLSSISGVLIVGLMPNSPAKDAGLRSGDVITYLRRQRVKSAHGFLNYIAQCKPGSEIKVTYLRKNKKHVIMITIGKRPVQSIIDDRGRQP